MKILLWTGFHELYYTTVAFHVADDTFLLLRPDGCFFFLEQKGRQGDTLSTREDEWIIVES